MPNGEFVTTDPKLPQFEPSNVVIGAVDHAKGVSAYFHESQQGILRDPLQTSAVATAAVLDKMGIPAALNRIEATLDRFAAREGAKSQGLLERLNAEAPDLTNGHTR